MNDNFDVVIVGGRVAGGTLATHLAKQGVKVCVIERDDLTTEPVSTHWIFANTVDRLINQIGVDRAQLMSTNAPPITAMTMEIGDGAPEKFPFPDASYCIRRSVLDKAILDAARKAGAEIRLNTRVTGILDDGHRVTGVQTPDGEIRARIVVGADGVQSTVARAVQAETWLDVPSERHCYFSYFQIPEGLPTDTSIIYFEDTGDRCGYTMFPTGNNQAVVCCYPINANLDRFKNDPEAALRAQLSSSSRIASYLGEQTDRTYGRNHMPTYVRRSVGPGWALVGDAGHFKDAVMAQGIGDSIHHATLLAPAIKQALDEPEREQEVMDAWERTRDLGTIEILFMAIQMSRSIEPRALFSQLIDDAASDPTLRPALGGIYQRTHRPSDLFNAKTLIRAAIRAVLNKRAGVGAVFAEAKEGFAGQRELAKAVKQIKSRPVRDWTLAKKAARPASGVSATVSV
jgi:flavin-dependent dehydrogenase